VVPHYIVCRTVCTARHGGIPTRDPATCTLMRAQAVPLLQSVHISAVPCRCAPRALSFKEGHKLCLNTNCSAKCMDLRRMTEWCWYITRKCVTCMYRSRGWKCPLERLRKNCEDNIKMDVVETSFGDGSSWLLYWSCELSGFCCLRVSWYTIGF
jgi:hypothetical protein